jgi:hypothetical protein
VLNQYPLALKEVQLFYNGVQVPRNWLTFTLSSTYIEGTYPLVASNCNDGKTNGTWPTGHCHTLGGAGDPNPSLTIVSTVVFDKVVVYNMIEWSIYAIQGATITATVNGQSKATTFPNNDLLLYTFVLSSSTLQYQAPQTAAECFKLIIYPTSAFKINNVQTNQASVTLGSAVQVVYNYAWTYGGSCPGCQVQIYAGVKGPSGTCPISAFSNQNGPNPNPYAISFQAQLTSGCNLLFATYTLNYNCVIVQNGPISGAIWATA